MPTNLIISNFWSTKITPMWFSALVGRKIAIFDVLDPYSPTLNGTYILKWEAFHAEILSKVYEPKNEDRLDGNAKTVFCIKC